MQELPYRTSLAMLSRKVYVEKGTGRCIGKSIIKRIERE